MPRAPRLTAAEKRAQRARTERYLRMLFAPIDPEPEHFLDFAASCFERGARLEAYLTLLIGFERHVLDADPDDAGPTDRAPLRAIGHAP